MTNLRRIYRKCNVKKGQVHEQRWSLSISGHGTHWVQLGVFLILWYRCCVTWKCKNKRKESDDVHNVAVDRCVNLLNWGVLNLTAVIFKFWCWTRLWKKCRIYIFVWYWSVPPSIPKTLEMKITLCKFLMVILLMCGYIAKWIFYQCLSWTI